MVWSRGQHFPVSHDLLEILRRYYEITFLMERALWVDAMWSTVPSRGSVHVLPAAVETPHVDQLFASFSHNMPSHQYWEVSRLLVWDMVHLVL